MAARDITLDQYAPLSHKTGLGHTTAAITLAPSWVGETHRRRLAAYRILHGYLSNVARTFFEADTTRNTDARLSSIASGIDGDERRDLVEYGDAALIVSRIADAILGETLTFTVAGADVEQLPEIGDPPADPGADATPIERRIYDAALARWERDATAAVDAWEEAIASQPEAIARQAWLREWAETDAAAVTLRLATLDAVGLGDGVVAIGWDAEKQRPTWTRYDPGFYFPAHPDGATDEFPSTVHIAWEEVHAEANGDRVYVRRQTWRLVPLEAPVTYPYADGPSQVVCTFSDGMWATERLEGGKVDGFGTPARWITEEVSLGVDFIPVVHIPGIDIGDDYGQSFLARVAMLLDEIIATDTDISKAQALAAGPAIALSGGSVQDAVEVEPGVVYNLGENGRMDVLDLSAGLSELRDTGDRLLDRLSVVSQVAGEVLGRVVDASPLSGVAVALRFGPFQQLILGARQVHRRKWDLALKMTQRLATVNGDPDVDGAAFPAHVVPGPFLPADLAGVAQIVAQARAAGAMSQETSVALFAEAGVPVADVRREVALIREGDPEGAAKVFAAVGEEAAADWLGVEPPPPAPAPDLGV